ncbi:restriction endonuclease subunit S [Pelomonas sp. V22]|uniref:restriction endonuclease subunit S n=1 Tax=Pelomonas sp. V22 TaxID=2822139 RepID=UPI0024A8D400|nr:restriction endonuclease subunit S [Pelomonas sp. V22]MDI4634711.1 restriction endonuclease subunit S [Pelomonas sp. V22]
MTVSETPRGWTHAKLGGLVEFKYGKALPERLRSGSGFPVFGSNGEVGRHEVPLTCGPTIVVGRKGSVGQVHFSAGACSPIDTTYYVDQVPGGQFRYWLHQLRSLELQSLNKSTAIPGLSRTDAYSIGVNLPPVAEQRRITDKLDTLLARVDAVNDRLARVAPLLKRFRQSVLAAATAGRLTEEWRGALASAPINSRHALDEILQGQSGRVRVRGEAARVSREVLYELPNSWAWVLNHELAEHDSNAICAGPFGTIFKAKDFRDEGVPIIFLRHIGEGYYSTRKPGFMATEVWREHHQPYSVYGGELLVTKLGDPPGTACIYPEGVGAAMVTPDVMKMSVNPNAADSRYLMHFFNSPNSRKIVEALCFGVTRLRIDLSMFKTFPIPLPPRDEQVEIVRRVELLFAYADRLEARLQAAQTAAQRLTPALLAKAFRGELVPQDPNDEPASELLKRLAASRAAAPKIQRGRAARAT